MAVVFISWEPALLLFEDGEQPGGCWPPHTSSSLQSHARGQQTCCCSPSACFFSPLHEKKNNNKTNTFTGAGIGSSSDPMQRSAVTTGQPEPSPPAPTLSIEFPAAQQHQGECKWGKPPPLGKHGLLRKRRHLPGEVLFIQGC